MLGEKSKLMAIPDYVAKVARRNIKLIVNRGKSKINWKLYGYKD